MKLLKNGAGAYLTGDAIADAVIRFGVALSNEHRVDLVEIPYRAAHGDIEQATITVGWQTHISAESRSDGGGEVVDEATTISILDRTHRLVTRGDTPMAAAELAHLRLLDDLY